MFVGMGERRCIGRGALGVLLVRLDTHALLFSGLVVLNKFEVVQRRCVTTI